MNLKLNIGNAHLRHTICISLVLLMGIGYSFSASARAESCQGGVDCLICARQLHHHTADIPTSMTTSGCWPDGQKSSCGFEAAPDAEKFYGIASTVRLLHPERSAIFIGASDEEGQFRLSRGRISPFSLSEPDGKTPIYLLNDSLLCWILPIPIFFDYPYTARWSGYFLST